MCGLAGIFPYRTEAPPVNQAELLRICESMLSRGPDGAGLWLAHNLGIGLAHRRLAIIDLSEAGAQPMVDAQTGNRIVFNGEVYNYRELRAEISALGVSFHSRSDTEVLLKLYALHGREMLTRLRGMFAFALWDEKKQGLLLARDPLGIKPLYIADDGKTLRFASQVKALLAGGNVDTVVEPAGHVGFFLWGHVPEPYTLYRGIRALPAGSSLWVDHHQGLEQPHRYFNLTAELAEGERNAEQLTAEEVEERFRRALLDSVRHHMLADVPVGVFLSAGLDSTSLAALAAEHCSEPLRTLTLGFTEFKGTPNDETPLAEAVAREFGFVHRTRWIDREEFLSDRERILAAMDQPSVDGVNTYFVSKAAKETGLKVALSGLGGDEILGGYDSFQQIPRLVRYAAPFTMFGKWLRLGATPVLRHFTSPKYAGILEYGGTYGGAYLLRRGMYMPWELPDILDADLVCEGLVELGSTTRLEETMKGIVSPHLRVSALEATWYMRNQLLRDSDWASMAHSLELRVPLVDVDLLRTVARLIPSGHPPGKAMMASATRRPLPEPVISRRKTGFGIPVKEWTQSDSLTPFRGLRGWATYVYSCFCKGRLDKSSHMG